MAKKTPSGKYRGRVQIGVDKDGKPISKYVSASRSAYRTMFNKHLLPAFGLRHLRAISASEIQAFINSFANSNKSQITLAVGTLKALPAHNAEGIIERDPSVSWGRPKA